MRYLFFVLLLCSLNGYSQWTSYIIGIKGDTLNRVDKQNNKQGKWTHRYETLRGEPGFEEEGEYKDNRKEGTWRKFSLMGDLLAVENYRWGFKDGSCKYFDNIGNLVREESWLAINPDKIYDTIDVEDVDNPDHFNRVVIKNEGASLKHGTWRQYNGGFITKTELYRLGKLENGDKVAAADAKTPVDSAVSSKKIKPKEVLEFEKKNAGKKKIRVRDGRTSL